MMVAPVTATLLEPDQVEAEVFIKALTGSSGTEVTWQTFDDSDQKRKALARVLHGSVEDHWRELVRLNRAGAGIFVQVSRGDGEGRTAKNVEGLRALFVDDDSGELTPAALGLTPSIVVQSKSGMHAYWRLRPGESLDAFTPAQEALAKALGTDPVVKDLPRVMRVPGFLHMKDPAAPFFVKMVQSTPAIYNIAQVIAGNGAELKAAPATPPPRALTGSTDSMRRAQAWIAKRDNASTGGRNAAAYATAAGIRDFGVSEEEALDLLRPWNRRNDPPLEEAELRDVVVHAFKYATGAPGTKPDKPRANGATGHQKPAKADLLTTYGIVRASTIAEEPTDWDWPGYLVRGALNLVEGNPEVGKTLLVLAAVANLSAGRPLPHGRAIPGQRRRVLFLTAEDSIAKTIVGRLKAADADLDQVLVQKERGADLYFAAGDLGELRQIVRGEGISAIALDPLNAYLNGIDVNKEQEVRSALRPIRDFAEDESTSIIGLRHLNKATDKPALYRGGGSIALAAVARSVLLVARHPDDHGLRVLLSQKCNLIEEEKRPPLGFRIVKDDSGRPRIEWLAEALDIDAETLLAPQKPGPKPDTLEKAKTYLQDHLRGGPKPRGLLLESGGKVGLSERSLERAAKALGVQSEPQGRERVWSL